MILSKVRDNNYTLLTAPHTYTWGLFINVCNLVDFVVLSLFTQLHTAALRLIVQSWLDVPTLATRRLHACHHATSPQRRKVELWARNVREFCLKCRLSRYI